MTERYRAENERSTWMRFHTQTAGVSLTPQQPLNNLTRVAIQALAAVLGGTQSLHTDAYDEALAVPTAEAALLALRQQQVIAEETGVDRHGRPAGRVVVRRGADERGRARRSGATSTRSTGAAGWSPAIVEGYPQREIAEAAYRFQREVDERRAADRRRQRVRRPARGARRSRCSRCREARCERHLARLERTRAERDAEAVEAALARPARRGRRGPARPRRT